MADRVRIIHRHFFEVPFVILVSHAVYHRRRSRETDLGNTFRMFPRELIIVHQDWAFEGDFPDYYW